jgi:MerR family copper efflux transcriptional regulator
VRVISKFRHYEALGLLGQVQREGAYRVYGANEILLIQLIKQAQGLGFRLAELCVVLSEHGAEPNWLALAGAIARKRLSVSAEIIRLQALGIELAQVEAQIRSCITSTEAQSAAFAPCDLALASHSATPA